MNLHPDMTETQRLEEVLKEIRWHASCMVAAIDYFLAQKGESTAYTDLVEFLASLDHPDFAWIPEPLSFPHD